MNDVRVHDTPTRFLEATIIVLVYSGNRSYE
jgi:hypothetical protein